MLGVLGGMGPMATVDFMAKVVRNTAAARDQDHIPMLVCLACDIPDRNAALSAGGADPLPAMQGALRRLEGAGATRVAIPCNTAHLWHGALQAGTALPILHIVDAVAAELTAPPGESVGLLATASTVAGGLYQSRLGALGLPCRVPGAAGQESVMRAIRLVKAGATHEAAALLRAQAEALVEAGCTAVVMACTEIPVALAGVEGPLRPALVDATEALARACIRAAREDAASALPRAA